ncbi:putative serine/threonine-protein kinase [Glycine soja]
MPEEWRRSTLVPIYKNKGDIQNCANYRGIKLMSHTMKLWERVIERRLRKETQVTENQFGFMPGRSTMEAIYLLRRVMEQYRMDQQDLHLIFIDLEKAYDRVPREILWKALEKKGVRVAYIRAIQDMYDRVSTSVRTQSGESDDFPITIGLHQGSTLSPYLFTLILDVLTEQIQEIAPRCMLFADDIVLLGESREELNERLETWRRALETHGFRLSRSKSEYMKCKFNKRRRVSNSEVKIGDHIIPQVTRFKYLGFVIQYDGEIEGDVNHRIQAGWMKWRKTSGVLCDAKVPIKLKGKFYRTAVRPAILYGTKCWAVKSQHENKVGVAEMRMLRWMCGKTRQDKIRNEAIRERVGVAPIVEKMVENRLRWFGHVERRPVDSVVRRVDQMERRQTIRGRGRPKKTIREVIKKDLELNDLDRSMVGQGTYSNVYKALDQETGEIVALKKVKFNTSEPESIKFMAREIMILQRLDHPNVLKLIGLATSRMQYSIYLVFDFMQTDLARVVARPEERLTEPQVKCYMHQFLSGLQHCHDRGILHRDIKGSNLLIDKNRMLKIADFGLANFYGPERHQPLTSRVVTLWYRAPQLLLGDTEYGVGVDLWSAGCLLAEMFKGIPIMPGRNEIEQLHKIFRLCGTPSEEYWRKLKLSTTFRPPKSYRPSLVETLKNLPPSSLGLLCTLLALDPAFRGSASKALKNQFFITSPLACDLSGLPVIVSEDDEFVQANEQIKYMNSKIRRSRTYMERRKNSTSKSPLEHTVSSKEELTRNAKPETFVPTEDMDSTSSTSSSVNPGEAKDQSPFFLSPFGALDQKLSPKTHHHVNGGEKNVKNLPPLPKSKPNASKKDESKHRPDHFFRSASTIEFRYLKREERLLLEIDD